MPIDLYPCFGFELLGLCKYDPQAPPATYFTIGDAISALAFTFAVQQILRPIYVFRLRAMGVKFQYLVFAVFFGAVCTAIAAAVPSLPFVRGSAFSYPVNWEIIGGLVIGLAYAVAGIISFRAAKVTDRNVENFSRAAVHLLAESNDEDRLNLAKDLLSKRNMLRLGRILIKQNSAIPAC